MMMALARGVGRFLPARERHENLPKCQRGLTICMLSMNDARASRLGRGRLVGCPPMPAGRAEKQEGALQAALDDGDGTLAPGTGMTGDRWPHNIRPHGCWLVMDRSRRRLGHASPRSKGGASLYPGVLATAPPPEPQSQGLRIQTFRFVTRLA